jgi:hypothetical protein
MPSAHSLYHWGYSACSGVVEYILVREPALQRILGDCCVLFRRANGTDFELYPPSKLATGIFTSGKTRCAIDAARFRSALRNNDLSPVTCLFDTSRSLYLQRLIGDEVPSINYKK